MDYHAVGTKSLIQLLEEAGYFENPTTVTESELKSHLSGRTDWCDAWVGYSQDRRTDSGWVISETDDGFTVFYYPKGNTKLKFPDIASACAAFAIRELSSLARHRD